MEMCVPRWVKERFENLRETIETFLSEVDEDIKSKLMIARFHDEQELHETIGSLARVRGYLERIKLLVEEAQGE